MMQFRAVVITGKYAVRASPREKRNITPFSGRMPSFVVILPSPRGHYANILPALLVDMPKDISFLKPPYTLPLSRLQHPDLLLQHLHLLGKFSESPLNVAEAMNLGH